MKTNHPIIQALALLALVSTLNLQSSTILAQGTAFTYQGQLQNNGSPANGSYEMQFSLYATNAGGVAIAGPVTNSAVFVTNGLFTVMVDFGAGVWNSQTNWLGIGVQTNGSGSFTTLAPRQQLTPVPYAITAENATLLANGVAIGAGSANSISAANTTDSFIGGGSANQIQVDSQYAAIDGGQNNVIQADASWSVIGGGWQNQIWVDSQYSAIDGGQNNVIQPESPWSVIGGGGDNYIGAGTPYAAIGGGQNNTNTASYGTVAGGQQNTASGLNATVGGGYQNTASGPGAFVGGGGCDGENFEGNAANGNASVAAGGLGNTVSSPYAMVGCGSYNTVQTNASYAFIGGGYINTASNMYSMVGGGSGNTASAQYAMVGGGEQDTASGANAFIGGGYINTASGMYSMVGGGSGNTASTNFSTVGGGLDNHATNSCATAPGGYQNIAGGAYSLAAGNQAQALYQGDFVWGDSQNAVFASTANDQFLIRAQGGVGIGTASPATPLHVMSSSDCQISLQSSDAGGHRWAIQSSGGAFGASLLATFQIIDRTLSQSRLLIATNGDVGIGNNSPTELLVVGTGGAYCNGTTWVNGSDRNTKEDFAAVNPRAVLEKVAALPITEWRYKAEAAGTEHIGPMAQDFHVAFGLNGDDDKHIATVDEGGVALAAIQGLNQKLNEKDAEIQTLKQQNDSLAQRLAELEQTVKTLAARN